MGGQHSLRGYLVQSLITVIDSLNSNEWSSVTLEPNEESEKVDIRWMYPNGEKKVVQVKSSINIFKYFKVQQWCTELENGTPDSTYYELILVGHPDGKLNGLDKIGNVTIAPFKALNMDSLLDEASVKIDKFYEVHGKAKIAASVRELLVKVLIQEMNFNAISGKEIFKTEFETLLLEWIETIEKQIALNPWSLFAPPHSDEYVPLGNRIVENIFELIGWNNFNKNESYQQYDQHLGEELSYRLDFRGEIESGLMDNTDDFIMVNVEHDVTYPDEPKDIIYSHIEKTNLFSNYFKNENKIPVNRNEETKIYSILFLLSSDNIQLGEDFIYKSYEYFRREKLEDDIQYLMVDNAHATFLISSIISAKNYRQELPVKFLYPITDLNSSPGKIGRRGLQLPPQYINSSMIPIVKESHDKISILLYCSDKFNPDYLKKLIWLIISLTSGYGNEYKIYFPDYDNNYDNDVRDIVRSFNDAELIAKLKVEKFQRVDAEAISNINSNQSLLSNEIYNEATLSTKDSSKILNKAFIEILPYGDILKPFLKTDAILSNDLKIFLSKRGLFVKSADKKKLITAITPILFSPRELEDFKEMIDIKEKTSKTSQDIFKLTTKKSVEEIVKELPPINIKEITKNTNTKILETPKFQKNPQKPNEFILEVKTEKKDPTNYLSVNTLYGKISISCRVDNDNLFINSIKTTTADDKLIASRIVAANKSSLLNKKIIENDSIQLLFSRFENNRERVNFLLSFSNIADTVLFSEAEIQKIKYKFDKSQSIPESLKDRSERDIVTYLNGKDLGGLADISDEDFKKLLLLDEVEVHYKYNWQNIKNGWYSVKYNFSNSLYNKKGVEGVFRSEPYLYLSEPVKKLSNIERLRKDLADAIEDLKIAKLKEYNII
ncbi:hypothetical protein HZP25_15600 [Elizabethkingia anophelis]|nr:hypothetical protein [Elizabethkingia anophelis]